MCANSPRSPRANKNLSEGLTLESPDLDPLSDSVLHSVYLVLLILSPPDTC